MSVGVFDRCEFAGVEFLVEECTPVIGQSVETAPVFSRRTG